MIVVLWKILLDKLMRVGIVNAFVPVVVVILLILAIYTELRNCEIFRRDCNFSIIYVSLYAFSYVRMNFLKPWTLYVHFYVNEYKYMKKLFILMKKV